MQSSPLPGGAGAVQRGGAERRVLPRQEERQVHRQEPSQGDQVRGKVIPKLYQSYIKVIPKLYQSSPPQGAEWGVAAGRAGGRGALCVH